MRLVKIAFSNIGPFHNQTLSVERDVTALTGPNDSGKSLLLRAISAACRKQPLDEVDVASHYLDGRPEWSESPDVGAMLTIEVETPERIGELEVQPGDQILARYFGAPNYRQDRLVVTERRRGDAVVKKQVSMSDLPVVQADFNKPVRDVIRLDAPNPLERLLCHFAFKTQQPMKLLSGVRPASRRKVLNQAEDRLTKMFASWLPTTLHLSFRLQMADNQPDGLHVYVEDRRGGDSTVQQRGAGIRRLLSIAACLLKEVPKGRTPILLIDEPETELHPDAQHSLRRYLDELAQRQFQIIYATHASSMLSPGKPRSVRLLEQRVLEDRAGTLIHRNPTTNSFDAVRRSLGLLPVDSLCLAPISVVVEGATEERCLPLVLESLSENDDLFRAYRELSGQCAFLSGWGDSLVALARALQGQGVRPLVLLDGDKTDHPTTKKLRRVLASAEIVCFDKDSEFEDIVPLSRYLGAVCQLLGEDGTFLTEAGLTDWVSKAEGRSRMMLSKRVAHWVDECSDSSYSKVEAMQLAIELTPVSELKTDTLRALLTKMQAVLGAC